MVFTDTDECADYALCWYHLATRVRLMEPMRTEDDNPAASVLYPDIGFVPTQRMHTFAPQRKSDCSTMSTKKTAE